MMPTRTDPKGSFVTPSLTQRVIGGKMKRLEPCVGTVAFFISACPLQPLSDFLQRLGKSKWGLCKWGLKVFVHNCPRSPTIVAILQRKFLLERRPKEPRKCTIVDDCAQIAESGLKPPFESPHVDFPERLAPENHELSAQAHETDFAESQNPPFYHAQLGRAGTDPVRFKWG